MVDKSYMQRAIDLAQKGLGFVNTNPLVGCVITIDNEIIGEGFHERYGGDHAEVNAIKNVLNNSTNGLQLLKKATLYVNLEPCAHFGKTPPCADLIIFHEIPRVVIACRDSFDEVNGKGIQKLQNAGVEVIVGVLEKEALWLNRRFFCRINKKRPYIILKWARTQDGFFAPDDHSQFWITNSLSKQLVHKWRAEEDCILIGKKTAEIDNPQLNVRLVEGRNPKRAVIDRDLSLSKNLHVFNNEIETFIFNKDKTTTEDKTKYIGIDDFDYFLPQYILFQFYLQDIQSLIIEGGAKTLQLFLSEGLWDEARIFTSNTHLVKGLRAPDINAKIICTEYLNNDELKIYINNQT